MNYDSKQAAEILGIGFPWVNQLCREGTIKGAYKEKIKWMIPKESLDSYMEEKKNETEKLVGQVFGDLTILEVLGYRQETKTNNRLFVKTGCECGNITDKPFYVIERGQVKCCGNECITKSGFKIGDRYGFQTILGDGGLRNYGGGRRKRFVKTICDCGNEKDFPLHKLKSGEQNYCGKTCGLKYTNIIGNKYGFLTVLEEIGRIKNQKDVRVFLCKCDCGELAKKRYNKLVHGYTIFCGHSCDLQRGENHGSWNPNKTDEERLQGRDYWEYNQWRNKVYIRDKFTCKCCGRIGGSKVAHHLDGYNWCIEKRTDVSNGITLCETPCHEDFHKKLGYGNNTKEQFDEYLSEFSLISNIK